MNDFEKSEEFRRAVEIAKKQAEMYQGIIKAYANISPEVKTKFQEIADSLNRWKNSLNNMPGLIKVTEMLRNYEQYVRANEGISEEEFEEKYRERIECSKRSGRNGWVMTQYASLSELMEWEQIFEEGEYAGEMYFDGEGISILLEIKKKLEESYTFGTEYHYYHRGIAAFENGDYMTAAMYLLGVLDYRVSKLVRFPEGRLSNRVKYSDKGFKNQKEDDFRKLSEKHSIMTKQIIFLDLYPSLIEYLNRVFFDGEYTFDKGVEPPYLNRNWLLHGRMSREPQRYECIQILNALSVIEFMFDKEEEES